MGEMERYRFLLHSKTKGYQRKLDQAREIVREALEQVSKPYVALSSGKDSSVAAHLVWEQQPDVPAVYFDADCAFPESSELLDRVEEQHTIIRWKTEPLLDTFERLGGPTAQGIGRATMESTVYAPVRSLLEAYSFDGVFLGLRSEESEGRKKSTQVHGSLYRYKRDGVLRCLPVAHWSYEDIWACIISQELDYNRAYDRMDMLPQEDRRISYWAGETKVRYGRWVWLKCEYPDLFNRFAQRFPEVREFV